MSSNSISNQALIGPLLIAVIVVCFREQLGRIDNRHLHSTLVAAMALGFVSGVAKTVLSRVSVPPEQLNSYMNAWLLPSICDSLVFCLISYHNTYRAMILLRPDSRKLPWIVATAITTIELGMHAAAAVVIQENMLKYYTLVRDTLTQQLTGALIIYVSVVDSFFFVSTQLRIVSVMKHVSTGRLTNGHYVDAAFRGLCFSGAIFLYFITLNGLFFDPDEGRCFLSTSPPILFIVLLTDSDRIRKLVFALRGDAKASDGGSVSLRARGATGQQLSRDALQA
ncbi:hypothetical protein DFJ73DRAFT_208298 [Zopfochytrium polystomum]|nr:hypothetical protein DFJ73DRAFT_208298 [Zopfochytrium polystomum]